jgi:two-component system, chemotaxis family, chemotaxis protein CheV
MELLVFHMGGHELFGLSVLEVREIMPVREINQLPGSSKQVMGCINVRGTTVPVIDMVGLLFPGRDAVQDSMGVILDREKPYALSVPGVQRIIKIKDEIIARMQSQSPSSMVEGVINDENGMIQVLNSDPILKRAGVA